MRNISFFPGPSALPNEVALELRSEMLDFKGTGLSIMEIGHRDPMVMELHLENIAYLKKLLHIDDNFEVLFTHAGASSQFFALPMNLLAGGKALYLNSGEFSNRAVKVARQYGEIDEVIVHTNHTAIKEEVFDGSGYSYTYYCPNETVNGLQFANIPFKKADIVADMTSCILASPIVIDDYSLIFASSQKNLGVVGLTIVVIKKDLLDRAAHPYTPYLFDYKVLRGFDSMPNTIPTWTMLVMNKMLKWYESRGGISEIYKENLEKAQLVYETIDNSNFYTNAVNIANRSILNPIFSLKTKDMEQKFLLEAEKRGFYGLAGHKVVGGIRISMYNAILLEDIKRLVDFMKEFALGKL